ncbi:MAG TPA: hypothetical protein ENN19_12915 [Chloroflexi bacterium]|nr:hypothetical protein [Chloroflexota bacterium]
MSDCPSCGRYAGPHEVCPDCGAHLLGRTSIRAIKITAILLATAGLVALWFAAINAEAPLISIGQAGATMNMAYVRLAGRCIRAPSYDPESDYLSFWLQDDTGEIRVSAYRAETRAIIEQGRIPALGDRIEVAGTLRVREDFLSITVNVPEQLQVTRGEPVMQPVPIGAITPGDHYQRVRVRGLVREIYAPYDGLTLITLRDASGAIPVAVSRDLVALSGISPTLIITTGQAAEVVGVVSLYRNMPQIVPASVADIVPLDQEISLAIEKPIGELTVDDVGQPAIVRGVIVQVTPFSAGQKLILDDGSGQITALLWNSVYESPPTPDDLAPGAEVLVMGEIAQYRGDLEIVPLSGADIQVAVAAPKSDVPTPVTQAIGDVTVEDVGETRTLTGVLGPRETFSAGVKFLLDDGTGAITLLLWQEVYEALPGNERLQAGVQVKVEGKIETYRGELEIIPRADGVHLLE